MCLHLAKHSLEPTKLWNFTGMYLIKVKKKIILCNVFLWNSLDFYSGGAWRKLDGPLKMM